MDGLLGKALDFSVRVIELSRYLKDENRLFPMTARLLECAAGVYVCLRISGQMSKNSREHCTQAFKLALEAECLLEMIVKTGFITQKQSEPILSDCRSLRDEINKWI